MDPAVFTDRVQVAVEHRVRTKRCAGRREVVQVWDGEDPEFPAGAEAVAEENAQRLDRRVVQVDPQVELAADEKQFLVESRSEQERLERVAELLDNARKTLIATRELSEKAKRNGHR